MVPLEMFKVLFGQLPRDEFVSPLSASILYFAITMLFGWMTRELNSKYTPPKYRQFVADFSATLEMCSYYLEYRFIHVNFGKAWLFVALMLQTYISNRTFFKASSTPSHAIAAMVQKETKVHMAMIRIGMQTLAGQASFYFARMIWALDMVPQHRERYTETSCATDLRTSLLIGFMVEGGGVLVSTWVARQRVAKKLLHDELVRSVINALLILVGIDLTGMYCNPAKASGHTYGCVGTSSWDHVLVYWAGPILGCVAALELNKVFHIDVATRTTSTPSAPTTARAAPAPKAQGVPPSPMVTRNIARRRGPSKNKK